MAGDLIIDKVAKTSTATKTDLMRGLSKTWVSLNQTGVQVVRNSLNIASITDLGVGYTSMTQTSASDGMATTPIMTGVDKTNPVNTFEQILWSGVSSFGVYKLENTSTPTDATIMTAARLGDLA
jgi:hypothetical protein